MKSRNTAIALFAIALAILLGTVTHSWFTAREVGVGLGGIEKCYDGTCHSAGWGQLRTPSDISMFGYIGLIGGVLAALACGATAVMVLTGRARKVPVKPMTIACGVAAFGQFAFAGRFMTEGGKHLSIGWSAVVALVGIIAAGVVFKKMVQPLVAAELVAAPHVAPGPQPYTIA